MNKISKKTSRLYSYALMSLMFGFVFVFMVLRGQASVFVLVITIPAFAAGIYFLSAAYSRSKKEL